MNIRLLYALMLVLLSSCSAAKDETAGKRGNQGPVSFTTVVDCPLYDGMSKSSAQLTSITSGMEVQVMDTVDAYFVKARVTKDGKTLNGFMYRTCFPQK
ncbi:hypothetical protein SAMN02745146_3108 [Hymenobacter daecheongensis DSM 21074]|uniref:SH3 domain-containing protein n=1 Tax=Hymenobacter daecheongensis DSM 21074 TaxID=1121955 RepID=A0A1M6J5P3_9BACT|nr:hypothetical protein [Hymenobacter daecheongensis]SHJ42030.1 hypothetical protein SAMN02745146_3108 [Hymenobacter daecheongensis DSM 21074]